MVLPRPARLPRLPQSERRQRPRRQRPPAQRTFHLFATGVTDNQLRTWNHIGLFTNAPDEASITNVPRLVHVDDTNYPPEYRVRSYLDANCAQCHRPNGVAGYFDARFSTPLAAQRLINGPLANSLGDANNRVVKPRRLVEIRFVRAH